MDGENTRLVKKSEIKSDNSHYFTTYGSGKPETVIREEVDNQIAARPTIAGITIVEQPSKCSIHTYNDGCTPNPTQVENMTNIGVTHSSKKGASICGVGQFEATIAGGCYTKAMRKLTVESVCNGEQSTFTLYANGSDYSLKTEFSEAVKVSEPDFINKTYSNMRTPTKEEIERYRALIGIKIHPYASTNDLKYMFNGQQVKPIDILYSSVEDESINRLEMKTKKVMYHGREYEVKYSAVDFSRYVKPDGKRIDTSRANEWDIINNLSSDSTGVFVEIGGVNVITGGIDSWRIINNKAHTTKNGINIWISIPEEGELKDAIFSESAYKATVGQTNLMNIVDYDGSTRVFEEIVNEINLYVNKWKEERDTISANGKKIKKEEKDRMLDEIFKNEEICKVFVAIKKQCTEKEFELLGTRKLSTIMEKAENHLESTAESLF